MSWVLLHHQGAISMPNSAAELRDAKYISLRSFKKDGQPVDTPVWFAEVAPDRLVVFTDGTSYKVKRIRRNPKVEIARCDMRGKLLGSWLPATCRPVEQEPVAIASAYDALNAKYGLLMRLGTVFATLAGRTKRRLVLEITLPVVP
jgi:PPOX class probable F420-dependent enzyme